MMVSFERERFDGGMSPSFEEMALDINENYKIKKMK